VPLLAETPLHMLLRSVLHRVPFFITLAKNRLLDLKSSSGVSRTYSSSSSSISDDKVIECSRLGGCSKRIVIKIIRIKLIQIQIEYNIFNF